MKEILNKLIIFKNPNYFEGKKITVWFYIFYILIGSSILNETKNAKSIVAIFSIIKIFLVYVVGVEILYCFFRFRLKLLKIDISKSNSRTIWMHNSLLYNIPTTIVFLATSNKILTSITIICSWSLYLINLNNTLTTLYSAEIQNKKRMYLAIFLIIPSCVMGLCLL